MLGWPKFNVKRRTSFYAQLFLVIICSLQQSLRAANTEKKFMRKSMFVPLRYFLPSSMLCQHWLYTIEAVL